MQFHEIEELAIEILQDVSGQYLLPYQVLKRIKQRDQSLGQIIEDSYPALHGNSKMGEGVGINYSPVTFVAHALDNFRKKYPEINKQWLDASDIVVEGVITGYKISTSIWSWRF